MFSKINGGKNAEQINVVVNGKKTKAHKGDTIAATLLANNIPGFKKSAKIKEPRGPLCGMGTCFECLVTVNGKDKKQACLTMVEEGMEIDTDEI